MTFYEFEDGDIVNTHILAYPRQTVELNGSEVTGSVFLEKKYLTNLLLSRRFQGYSEKEGGFVEKDGPFSSSIDIVTAQEGGTNKQLYRSILNLYNYYSLTDASYTPYFTGSETVNFRVITIPEIFYDREVLTGSLTASDEDSTGASRVLYDNGRGGIYSGSLTGTLLGNVFYSEGLVVLKGASVASTDEPFGNASVSNFKWKTSFKGTHKIPVKIFRCRAPAGELNASTNSTYYHILTGSGARHKNEKEIVMNPQATYITAIGLYNEDYELVGLAKLAQPIKKTFDKDIMFRIRLDY
jgi:hypothetical protein